jgi:hypothetical protein
MAAGNGLDAGFALKTLATSLLPLQEFCYSDIIDTTHAMRALGHGGRSCILVPGGILTVQENGLELGHGAGTLLATNLR